MGRNFEIVAQQHGSGSNDEEGHVEYMRTSVLGALIMKSLMA